MNEFLIVRHSERMDEVDYPGWQLIVESDITKRCRISLTCDPHLTQNGKEIAAAAAESVLENIKATALRDNKDICNVRIYTSKLIRSVQTAYHIALALNVPLYACSGLALTAAAVEKHRNIFEFLTIEDIQAHCPGVQVVCCDTPDSGEYFVRSDNWLEAVAAIAERGQHINVIVAHRETIRNFCGKKRVKTPYCCFAKMRYDSLAGSSAKDYKSLLGAFRCEAVFDMHHNMIHDLQPPPPTPTQSSDARPAVVITGHPFQAQRHKEHKQHKQQAQQQGPSTPPPARSAQDRVGPA